MDGGEREPQVEREELVRRIGFAERWLSRARDDVTDGRLARGVLSLLLAEAEVHRARERSAPARAPAVTARAPTAAVLAAAILVVGLAAGFFLPGPRGEVAPAVSYGAPIVRLRESVGRTLVLIPAAAPPAPTVTAAPAARTAPAPPSAPAVRRKPVVRPAADRPAVMAPAAAPAAKPAPAPLLVSDGELIELVLAAERSLRGAGP